MHSASARSMWREEWNLAGYNAQGERRARHRLATFAMGWKDSKNDYEYAITRPTRRKADHAADNQRPRAPSSQLDATRESFAHDSNEHAIHRKK